MNGVASIPQFVGEGMEPLCLTLRVVKQQHFCHSSLLGNDPVTWNIRGV
jgi:hypothetical protein